MAVVEYEVNVNEMIKEVLSGKTATFDSAVDGALWYKVLHPHEERGSIVRKEFRFPVPFADVEGGRFMATEKAAHLMRWIRRQITENISEAEK